MIAGSIFYKDIKNVREEYMRFKKGVPHGRSDPTRTGDLYHPKVVR